MSTRNTVVLVLSCIVLPVVSAQEVFAPLAVECRVGLLELSQAEQHQIPAKRFFGVRLTDTANGNFNQAEVCCPVNASCADGLPPCPLPDVPCCPIRGTCADNLPPCSPEYLGSVGIICSPRIIDGPLREALSPLSGRGNE